MARAFDREEQRIRRGTAPEPAPVTVVPNEDPELGSPDDWDYGTEDFHTYPFEYFPDTKHAFMGADYDNHSGIDYWWGQKGHPGWRGRFHQGRANVVGNQVSVEYGDRFHPDLPDVDDVQRAVHQHVSQLHGLS